MVVSAVRRHRCIQNDIVEGRLVPSKARSLDQFRIGEVRNCAGLASHYAVKVEPDPVIVLHERVAFATMTVESELEFVALAGLSWAPATLLSLPVRAG